MAYTDINSEDRLVQATFAEHLEKALGWDSVYAWNQETFGPTDTLGRASEREVVLVRDLRAALVKLNSELPEAAINEAVAKLKEQTQAEVEVFILDHVYRALPEPPYTAEDKTDVAKLVYRHIWQQSASGLFGAPHKAAEAAWSP
ncbi:MAG: hypothetical protein U1A72_05805 [Sulfuritalea sp.]|nr:hypothetical protein [Sulfuritalea sp.]